VTLIPTKSLARSQVPAVDPSAIDYREDVREQLSALWAFALSFDGYKYFGGDDDAPSRLGQFAESVERAYLAYDSLPALAEIGMLRACLFYEQRNWCKWGKVMSPMRESDVRYFAALADAIRARL
jgi:hypothetical protein